jgi:hypothetical protein
MARPQREHTMKWVRQIFVLGDDGSKEKSAEKRIEKLERRGRVMVR